MSVLSSLQSPNNFVLLHISNLHSKRSETQTHARIRTKSHFLLTDLQ